MRKVRKWNPPATQELTLNEALEIEMNLVTHSPEDLYQTTHDVLT